MEDAAVRECQEETGVICRNLKPLGHLHQGLDAVYNLTHIFYTSDFTETKDKNRNPSESVEHHWVPINQSIEMIFSREIADSFTIASLLSFRAVTSDLVDPERADVKANQ